MTKLTAKEMTMTQTPETLIASDALAEGRVADALLIYTATMPLERALTQVAPMPAPKMGDILVCSWGYDQTNIDYYQVVGVTKASVKIREVLKTAIDYVKGSYEDQMVPLANRFDGDKIMTKRFTLDTHERIGYSVKISSYSSASLWNGKPQGQTGSGYGH